MAGLSSRLGKLIYWPAGKPPAFETMAGVAPPKMPSSQRALTQGRSYNLHTLKIRGLANGLVHAGAQSHNASASTQECACANKAICSADVSRACN